MPLREPSSVKAQLQAALRQVSDGDLDRLRLNRNTLNRIVQQDNLKFGLEEAAMLEALLSHLGKGDAFQACFDKVFNETLAALGGHMTRTPTELIVRVAELAESIGAMAGDVRRASASNSPGGSRITAAEAKAIYDGIAVLRGVVTEFERDVSEKLAHAKPREVAAHG